MRDKIKDQQLTSLNEYIDTKSWDLADKLIKSWDVEKPIKEYNLAYLKFKQGLEVDALMILDHLKYSGMYSKDVRFANDEVKKSLDIYFIEERLSPLDKIVLEAKLIPQDFFISGFLSLVIIGSIFLFLRKKIFGSLIISLSFIFLTSLYFLGQYELSYNLEEKVVFSGPSKIFEQIQVLPRGLKVIMTKEDADWRYIEYPKSFQGWIYQPKVSK